MQKKIFQFSSKRVSYYFDADFSYLEKIVEKDHAAIITDENIFKTFKKKFDGWNVIVIKAGEEYKVQETVDKIVKQLIEREADRKTFLIGVGGGIVTDITGFVGSVYMRGVKFGFVPTSLLAMVDASIGGKNGIDVGAYKNLIGTINQPDFLLYDISFLKSLPQYEWTNSFAEIIKHACIKDVALFKELEKNKLSHYQKNKAALVKLISRNALLKSNVVQKDEFETGERQLLNFGHTLGHAIEKVYELSHGHAISIGMVAACILSEHYFDFKESSRVITTLDKYGLPTLAEFEPKKVFDMMKMDKKKVKQSINYVLLKKVGHAETKAIPINELEKIIYSIIRAR
ncbi:MAG TPA: 3-dehydroquinate synthase [Puia sp.]|nr:3-dehydroquinate synthase [Puia sp.]